MLLHIGIGTKSGDFAQQSLLIRVFRFFEDFGERTVYWKNESEIESFLRVQEIEYEKFAELIGKKKQWGKDQVRSMRRFLNNRGYIPKEKIIKVNDGIVKTLSKHLETFPSSYKTDITPKILNKNNTIPAIHYKN